jgi:hypothetical protein
MRRIRSGPDGRFGTAGLPPGLYLVAAVGEGSIPSFPDRRVFEELAPSATLVTLAEGTPANVRLRIVERKGGT